jgi:tellurite resistance protein
VATHGTLGDVLLRVMAMMTAVDGDVDQDEVRRLRAVYRRVAGTDVNDADICRVLEESAAQNDVVSYLESVRGGLSEAHRRKVLKAAFVVATADGFVLDEEDELMATIARALEITPTTYRAMLSQMMVAREVVG